MVGPLAQLFAQQKQDQRAREIMALRDRLAASDPGGTIYLDEAPPTRVYDGPVDWLFNKPPAAPTPSFRDSSAQAGPSPPTGRAPLAAMYGTK